MIDPAQNNIMRNTYRELTGEEKEQVSKIKAMGLAFTQYLDAAGASREISLAKTKMEEAVMWATKHISQ